MFDKISFVLGVIIVIISATASSPIMTVGLGIAGALIMVLSALNIKESERNE